MNLCKDCSHESVCKYIPERECLIRQSKIDGDQDEMFYMECKCKKFDRKDKQGGVPNSLLDNILNKPYKTWITPKGKPNIYYWSE